MAVVAWVAPAGWNGAIVLALMSGFMLLLGAHIGKRPLGILVNQRNLMSLSRFQATLWTLVILSGYFTMALMRIKANIPDPVAIQIDWHLWVLMGISATSLVGSPLIASMKKAKEPDPAIVTKTATACNHRLRK